MFRSRNHTLRLPPIPNPTHPMSRTLTLVLSCTLFLAGCADHAPPVPREAPRPIEVYTLSEVNPSGPLELTGSVASWKEQDVAFEVAGRVKFVQETGTPLEGRWAENSEVIVEGDLLAEVDDRPYRIAVAAAQASVSVAESNVAVATAQLEQILPADLRAARAERDYAEAEYERYRQAGETRAVANVDVLRAKASRDIAVAKVEQREAAAVSKEAEKQAMEAQLSQALEQLAEAQWELDRCRLFAPFSGEVSEVFVEAGGYVNAGEKVAHLVMMDPIQVDIAVSQETLRQLERYSTVRISVPGFDEPLSGRIYDLATVADTTTRTFRVSIIVRNQQEDPVRNAGGSSEDLPRFGRAMVPLRVGDQRKDGPFFVESRRSLHQDAEGWFVFAADLVKADDLDRDNPVITVRKVRVTPGEKQVNFQGIYVLRELVDAGELDAETLLPLDLPAEFPDGGKIVLADAGWVLRPGQVVSVLMEDRVIDSGLFVPMHAVLPEGPDVGHVFVARDGKAQKVRIRLGDRIGPLVRVQAADADQASLIGPGAQVVRQAHFLHEGESVRVVRSHEVRP